MASTIDVMTAADLSDLIPEKWATRVLDDAYQRGFWSRFAGKEGSMSAVLEKDEFTKDAGDKVHFEVLSELYGQGVTGESAMEGNEDEWDTNQFDVEIEYIRNAVGLTKKANKEALIDAIQRTRPKLSRWLVKRMDEDMFGEMLSPSNATATTLYAGTATSTATLSSSSRLTLDTLDLIGLALERKGALPIEIIDPKGANQPIQCYAVVIDEVSANRLVTNDSYRTELQNVLPRSFSHPLLTGALGMHNNVMIYKYGSINQGCHQGTPLRPECALTTAATIGLDTLTVGTNAKRDYTKHFPDSGTLYIYADGTNAEETVTYTGKTMTTFTGIQVGDSGCTIAHAVGARVAYQQNRSQIIGFGSEVIARAWGEHPVKIAERGDYGMKLGVGIEAVYGQSVIEDSAGNVPNMVICEVFADLPNYGI